MIGIGLLDEISRHRTVVANARHDLRYLARAFFDVGNAKISDELSHIASNLEASFNLLNEAIDSDMKEAMCQTEQASRNVVEAAIAGILSTGPRP